MSEEILSIIVPIYNVEKYLPQCIDSILQQTYKNIEVVLVDDGSTDSSGEIADHYSKTDKRVQVVHKANGGLISARYAGLSVASGNFITFVDSDDWINSNMYQILMTVMLEQQVDLVTSGCIRYFSEKKTVITYDKLIEVGYYDASQIQDRIIPIMLWDKRINVWALDPSLCTKIFKKDILQSIYAELQNASFYYGEDSAVIFSYVLHINNFYCLHDAFYFHRQRMTNAAPYFVEDDFFSKLKEVYDHLFGVFAKHICRDDLIRQLDCFFVESAKKKLLKYGPPVQLRQYYYLFPFDKISENSKLIIYGAGMVGHDYKRQLEKLCYSEVVLWVDKNYTKYESDNVSNPENILIYKFDYVIIAIENEKIAGEVTNYLVAQGISKEKIIWDIARCSFNDNTN